MARNQLNLNRFRKIYPQLRKSPHYWIRDSHIREVKEITLSGGSHTFTTTVSINSPVAVASPVGTNSSVNVWVYSIVANGDYWDISIAASDSSYSGVVHVIIGDSNP